MFIDPSIAVVSLGLTYEGLLQDFVTFGFVFENLCFRDLKVYSSALKGKLSYYRDRTNLEAAAILHLNDGRYALIEFKLGSKQIDDAVKHLLELKQLIKNANMKEPDLLLIITGGEMAFTRSEGVKIISIACLKD